MIIITIVLSQNGRKEQSSWTFRLIPKQLPLKKASQGTWGAQGYGTGDVQITTNSMDDFEKAKPLIGHVYHDG